MSNHIDPKMQEIIDRHAAATPGPWQAEGKEIWRRGDGYSGENRHVYITDVQDWENRNFIANAWADEAYLLSEYKRLQQENAGMKEALEWTKRRFDEEWTYEMGIGEVVDEIIKEFDEALSHLKGE